MQYTISGKISGVPQNLLSNCNITYTINSGAKHVASISGSGDYSFQVPYESFFYKSSTLYVFAPVIGGYEPHPALYRVCQVHENIANFNFFYADVSTYPIIGSLRGLSIDTLYGQVVSFRVNGGVLQSAPVDLNGNFVIEGLPSGDIVDIYPPAVSGFIPNPTSRLGVVVQGEMPEQYYIYLRRPICPGSTYAENCRC